MTNKNETSRRDFLKTSAAAAGVLAGGLVLQNTAHAAGDDKIKVGVIGCGGRGTQACENVLCAAPGVEIIAMADAFEDRLNGSRNSLMKLERDVAEKAKSLGNTVDVPKERCFVGLDAFEKLLKTDVNYVILATTPGFRPIHLQAAVAAKKNIFTEKPVATDATGIRKVIDAYEEAKKANLAIVAGTQRRHQKGYIETMKRVQDGAIGDLVAGQFYWNQNILWAHPRKAEWKDLEYQIRNWYNFTWLCGDHIVEQHVHNLDVMCWAFGGHPDAVVAMGGRSRSNPDYGHIFDFFAMDFEYPKAVHTLSMCRQINNCANSVSEHLVGTKGRCDPGAYSINGESLFTNDEKKGHVNPYVQEHTDLIASIRANKPLNELQQVAHSTATAIMGRMSAYTGKRVTWDMVMKAHEDLMPAKLDWDMKLETPAVAVPGTTKFV